MSQEKPKFTLNLSETNTLGFALTIEGTSTDVDSTNPVFRFVLSERNGEKAWLYPMARDEEGDIVVAIPTENHFQESKTYQGQVEVVLGNHYFVPTTVDIEFIRPLKVEAVARVKNNTGADLQEEAKPIRVSSVTAKTKNKVVKEEIKESKKQPLPVQTPTKQKRNWEDLSEAEQKKVMEMLREKKLNELRKSKEQTGKKKPVVENNEHDVIKDHLKNLLTDSLFDEEEE
jgi:hypothetical protein